MSYMSARNKLAHHTEVPYSQISGRDIFHLVYDGCIRTLSTVFSKYKMYMSLVGDQLTYVNLDDNRFDTFSSGTSLIEEYLKEVDQPHYVKMNGLFYKFVLDILETNQ